MKKGFTLAEVLITLGIIGVVAAMTIPTLIQNTNSVKFASQFKKSISTLSQAALMSQAQYDVDYSGITTASNKTSCGSDTVSTGTLTMCGILNNTLAGQTFYGAYGDASVKAANGGGGSNGEGTDSDKYTFNSTKVLPDKAYLVYSLADGSYVGFDPAAKECGLGAGNVLDGTVLSQPSGEDDEGGGLANCIGFIDVNGPTPPNKEVTCNTESDTALNPSSTCDVARTGSKIGDIFPIVFHDGVVEPASNAAKMVLTRGK